jgi:hypothetical protein
MIIGFRVAILFNASQRRKLLSDRFSENVEHWHEVLRSGKVLLMRRHLKRHEHTLLTAFIWLAGIALGVLCVILGLILVVTFFGRS